MKTLAKGIKITSIVLNGIFLAGLIYGVTRYGAHPRDGLDKAGLILIFIFPAVAIVTIALTFLKKARSVTFVMMIIAVMINILFLIILISSMIIKGVNLEHFTQLMVCIWGLGLPVVNIVAFALTFRKGKQQTLTT